MVPSFIRVASKLKGLIEDEVNIGESKINFTPYLSKATLDIIGLVGKKKFFFSMLIIFVFHIVFHIIFFKKNFFLFSLLGFNYEFNSLTSSNELAEAYEYLMNPKRITLNLLSNSLPFVRKIPIDQNIGFNNACKVIERASKSLVEEKYHDDENKPNGKDLISLLININKTLPTEEKMTDDELKYQVIKNKK